jgi:hypothetical protein
MTGAERVRRFREQRSATKHVTELVTKPEAANDAPLRARIAELEAEVVVLKKAAAAAAEWQDIKQQLDAMDGGGVFNQEEYKRIAACLHPDRVAGTALEKKYTAASALFSAKKKLLVNRERGEPELRPPSAPVPRTAAGWAVRKRVKQEEAKRKRAATKAAKGPKRRLHNHAEV